MRSRCTSLLAPLLLLAVAVAPASASDWLYHTRAGDSLWSLCLQYTQKTGCWVELAHYNGFNKDQQIPVDTLIRIPVAWLKTVPTIGTALDQDGSVGYSQYNDDLLVPLRPHQDLHLGSRIETGDGWLQLQLAGGNNLFLRQESALLLDHLTDVGNQGTESRLLLEQGALEARIDNSRGNRFRVETPTAAVAVRGTNFRISANAGHMLAEVTEGSILVSTDTQQKEVAAGYGLVVAADQPLPEPSELLAPVQFGSPRLSRHLPIDLRWQSPEGAASFQIDLFDAGGRLLGTSTSITPAHRFEALAYGCYGLRVRAVAASGLTGRDARTEFCAEPFLDQVLLVGDNLTREDRDVLLHWQAARGAATYRVEVAADDSFTQLLGSFTTAETRIQLAALAKEDFYVRVQAVAEDGRQSAFSNALAHEAEQRYPDWVFKVLIAVLVGMVLL